MDNIISLVPKGEKEPSEENTEVINVLEDLLDLAKRGEIRGVAGAYTTNDGSTGSYYYAPEPIRMVGALEVTKHYLLQYQIEI